jgi:hypothetical protein
MRIDIQKNSELNKEYPQELLDYYTRRVNENYFNLEDAEQFKIKYEYDEEAKLIKNISPFEFPVEFTLPKDTPSEINSASDFEKYIYNSQAVIELDNERNPFVMIENEKIPVKDMILDKRGKPTEDYQIGLAAIPFDENDKFDINLDIYGTQKVLCLKRKPHNSVNTRLYQNEDFKELFIFSLKIDEDKISLSITPIISKPTSVCNVIFVNELIQAFKEKDLKINGKSMSSLFKREQPQKTIDNDGHDNDDLIEKINMWKNIHSLEQKLGRDFLITLPLNPIESRKIEELLVSLLLNKPFIDDVSINSININCESVDEFNNVKSKMSEAKEQLNSIMVGGQIQEKIELLGGEFTLFERYQAINVLVTDVIDNISDLELELRLQRAQNGDSYVVRKYSKDSIDYSEIESDLKDAKHLDEYTDIFLSRVIDL